MTCVEVAGQTVVKIVVCCVIVVPCGWEDEDTAATSELDVYCVRVKVERRTEVNVETVVNKLVTMRLETV